MTRLTKNKYFWKDNADEQIQKDRNRKQTKGKSLNAKHTKTNP